MARALGSYPSCHRFESSRRYHPEEAAMPLLRAPVLIPPALGIRGPVVKRLRHRPFTAVTRVRFPSGSPIWRLSSAGRALASHARGHRFEFCSLHQINIIRIFSPSGTGSDLLFIWTESAHKKAAPVSLTGAVPFMYSPAGASIPQTPLVLPDWRRSHGGMEATHRPLYLLCILADLARTL